MKKYRNDIVLIVFLLLLCLASFLVISFQKAAETDKLQIYGDGELLAVVPAGQSACLLVCRRSDGYAVSQFDSVKEANDEIENLSDYNLIVIERGMVSVYDADCSGQDCVRQRGISKNGESLICLPHRVLLCLSNAEEKAEDAVTW